MRRGAQPLCRKGLGEQMTGACVFDLSSQWKALQRMVSRTDPAVVTGSLNLDLSHLSRPGSRLVPQGSHPERDQTRPMGLPGYLKGAEPGVCR
jgi:hypothetical protein